MLEGRGDVRLRYLVGAERVFGDSPGGAHRVAWRLAELARDAGHDVTLLAGSTESDGPPGAKEIAGVGVVRYRFPRTWDLSPRRLSGHVNAVASAAAELSARGDWDVVHAHGPIQAAGLYRVASVRARRVYTVHSSAVLEQRINWRDAGLAGWVKLVFGTGVLRRLEREVLRKSHVVHVLSDYTQRTLQQVHGIQIASKAIKVPWWVNDAQARIEKSEARRRLKLPQGPKVLFSLRRMVPRMGLDLLIRAAEQIADAFDFVLVLAGDGPDRLKLESLASREGLATRVRFLGRISDEQAAWAYDACDVFVLPTRALEGFGIIILEAFAHDRPVLGANVGSIPELLSPVLPGWLFQANDVASLAARLAAYLSGELTAPPAGELARYCSERFGKAKVSREYLSLLFSPMRP